ncbi:glucose dehydrogenase [FAD, quinone]-like [Aedes albopictus]|uniref:Glucose-methanol-choline oxidoreductase N-terminal domain-containing protein n=1 Tax=Aedes albopictus TaxID=7160 RepID=A0ABM1ZY45_AEDAL
MLFLKLSVWCTYVLYLLGTALVWLILNGSYQCYEWYHSGRFPSKSSYEYIIVGTGTAGSIIAGGIPASEDVLGLEAGSMRSGLMDVPLLQPLLQGTRYDWGYRTEVQDGACEGLNERRSYWPMGKVFGGTYMFNNMVHYRAERKDFREWFGGEQVLDEFMEGFEDVDGVGELSFSTELSEAFIQAAGEAGLEKELFYRPNVSVSGGRRWTSSHKYADQINEGHEMIFNAVVTKIIFEGKRATGLVFSKAGKHVQVKATKGIILAAGTVGSAKILLQSGVGPKEHLDEIGIKQIAELKVGENLQDHITTGMDLVLLSKRLPFRVWDLLNPVNIGRYLFDSGRNSSIAFGGCEGLGFVNLGSNFTHNLGFMVLPVGITFDAGYHLRNVINLREDVWNRYFQPLVDQGAQSVTILPILLHPESRGTVKLRDSNPHSSPLIQPNYLREQKDIQTLITGLKILQQMTNQPSMRALGAELNPKPFPGCEQHPFGSDSYWECYIRALTLTIYHPVGTCRMGPEDDPDAVVSNRDFRVHQLDGLYVVDGSIMPNLPSGNPNSVIIALAKHFLRVNFSVQ